MSFADLSRYYQLIDQLMHLGTAAAHALTTGDDPNGTAAKVTAHIDSMAATVDAVGAVFPFVVTPTSSSAQPAPALTS